MNAQNNSEPEVILFVTKALYPEKMAIQSSKSGEQLLGENFESWFNDLIIDEKWNSMIDPDTYYLQQEIFHSRILERVPPSTLKINSPIHQSSPCSRPGTPPLSILMQSAPMRIPKSKHLKIDEDIEDNTRNLSKSVPLRSNTRQENFHSYQSLASHNLPSELIGPFVGSFQESLLSGHMSNTPSTTYDFQAELGVCGANYMPPHLKTSFSAIYYHVDHDTPYVGTIELEKKGFKVCSKGIIQLTVRNPTNTPIKTFLVKYDLTDMPPLTKTFLRQKITTSLVLRYAIHLKFVSPKKNKYYLYKNVRVVFAHRMPDDMDASSVSYDAPDDPKYFTYTPNSSANKLKNLRHSLS